MSEHICRNCRWWEELKELQSPEPPGGWMRECLRCYEPGHLASARYGEAFGCKADFGCVQWEGKEPTGDGVTDDTAAIQRRINEGTVTMQTNARCKFCGHIVWPYHQADCPLRSLAQ